MPSIKDTLRATTEARAQEKPVPKAGPKPKPKSAEPQDQPVSPLPASDGTFVDPFAIALKKGATKEATAFAGMLVKSLQTKLKQQKSNPDNAALLSDDSVLSSVTEFIPSGFPDLDRILGGGWPVGRASEVFGAEGSGKSALTHMALRSCQAMGGVPTYIDFEAALDPDKMEQLGIDPDRIVYCSPKDIEEAWDLIWEALDTIEAAQRDNKLNAPTLIVWDSIAAAMPRAEADEKSSAQSHVGLVARAMSKGCRKMFRRIAEVRAHMMWVNQERDKIGGFSPFGPEKQTTGGAAVRYAASLRCRVAKVSTLKIGTTASGYLVQVSTKKNRCAPPHQKSTYVLDFTVGPSTHLTVLQHLIDKNVIKSAGGGNYVAPWSKLRFEKTQWLPLLHNNEMFAQGAFAAYKALVAKFGSDTKAGGSSDESSSDD